MSESNEGAAAKRLRCEKFLSEIEECGNTLERGLTRKEAIGRLQALEKVFGDFIAWLEQLDDGDWEILRSKKIL
jgi:hypothetical protein